MAEETTGRKMLKDLEARVSVLEGGKAAKDPQEEDIKQIRRALKDIRDQLKVLAGEDEEINKRIDDLEGIA